MLYDVVFCQRFLRVSKRVHQRCRIAFKPIFRLVSLGDDPVLQLRGAQSLKNFRRRGMAKGKRINRRCCDVCNPAAYPLPCILYDDLLRVGMVGKFSFNDYAKPAQLKENVGAMLTVNMDGLCVRSDPEPGNQDGELSVYYFLAVSLLLRHSFCSSR